MSSADAITAHLDWQPFRHGPDCAEPAWEVAQQTEADQRRPRRDGPEHECPNEECGHHGYYDRIAVRVLCRSCGIVHLIGGEEHTSRTTTTVRTGYGQAPKKAGGLWLYAGPPLLDLRDYTTPGAYLCSLEEVDQLSQKDVVGAITEGRGKRGATVWSAAVGPDFQQGYTVWAKNSGDKTFSTVAAAAKWVTAELNAAATIETKEDQ